MSSSQHAVGSVYAMPQCLPQKQLPATALCAPPCSARPCQAPGGRLKTQVPPSPFFPVQPSASHPTHGILSTAFLQLHMEHQKGPVCNGCWPHAAGMQGFKWGLVGLFTFFLRHSLMACWKPPGTASSILYLTGFSSSPGPCQHLSSAKFP